jgi:hypothetical protein
MQLLFGSRNAMLVPPRFYRRGTFVAATLATLLAAGLLSRLDVAQPVQIATGVWRETPVTKSTYKIAPGGSQVFDREGLMRVRSFCIATRHVEGAEEAALKQVLADNSQPGKLLTQLPWKLTNDCASADAVVRIYFDPVELTRVESVEDGRGKEPKPKQTTEFQPVLLVYDRASIRLFYRAEGKVLRGNATDVLGSPFSMLFKDLQGMQP